MQKCERWAAVRVSRLCGDSSLMPHLATRTSAHPGRNVIPVLAVRARPQVVSDLVTRSFSRLASSFSFAASLDFVSRPHLASVSFQAVPVAFQKSPMVLIAADGVEPKALMS